MINYIKKIWSKLITSFSRKTRNANSYIRRFKIDNFVKAMGNNSKRKKFRITNEKNVPKRNERFNIVNKSRPLRCGRCGSEKSYTKVGNFWKCKVCNYKIKA